MTTREELEQQWNADPGQAVRRLIAGLDQADWPDEFMGGDSPKMHSLLARTVAAIGGPPTYASGQVGPHDSTTLSAVAFTDDTVVRVTGDVEAAEVSVYPNTPTAIKVLSAPVLTGARRGGHLEFVVEYPWGEVAVGRTLSASFGSPTDVLVLVRSKLGGRSNY